MFLTADEIDASSQDMKTILNHLYLDKVRKGLIKDGEVQTTLTMGKDPFLSAMRSIDDPNWLARQKKPEAVKPLAINTIKRTETVSPPKQKSSPRSLRLLEPLSAKMPDLSGLIKRKLGNFIKEKAETFGVM